VTDPTLYRTAAAAFELQESCEVHAAPNRASELLPSDDAAAVVAGEQVAEDVLTAVVDGVQR